VSVETVALRNDLTAAVRPVSAAAVAGCLAGTAIGGIGGRLAMFVLRLTSDPSLRGLKTDDDFTIGIFSGATLFLLLVTAFLGVVGGLVYLAIRPWLPAQARPWLFGGLTGIVGGATVIRPGGIDFTALEPLGLAVAMFVVLPAAYGVAVSLIAEWFLARDSAFARSKLSIAGLLVLLPLGVFGLRGLAVLALILVAVLVGRAAPAIASLWNSPPVAWIGRVGLGAIAIVWSTELVRDTLEIL
jgi:hypothetical protein